jgi:eukaryotic-like serine/threonine-protein kinase
MFGRFVVLGGLGSGGMGIVLSALDPDLDRKVAIKLLRAELGDHARARPLLQREAQVMARLAHPNVVAVYEVGRVGDQPFIAMEMVDGTTLHAWLAERPRGWREIVAMFVAAGRGLAAAHAVGVTHRDFKPENVLIGNDGRPRVSDFGIATRRLDRAPELAEAAPIDVSARHAGVPVGTPAYMAPEQWRGEDTDARTDQFAFAVALWSALYRARPFGGTTTATLRSAVLAGAHARPAQPGRAPRWLLPILARALAAHPDRRWPTLTALLDQLERRAATRRRTGIALAASVTTAALALALAPRPVADPCPAPDVRVAELWGPMRRAAIAQRAAAVDPAYGAQRFLAAARVLDPGLVAWSAMHVAACRATQVDGTQSDHLLDLRMRCLADWLDPSRQVASGLATATTPAEVEAAVHAVAGIPRLERCADARALAATIEQPTRPADRVASEAILAEVKAMMVARRAGQLGLAGRADAVLARARRLGHPFALSRALGVRWRIAISEQDTAGAATLLREQVEVAARAHDDEEAAKSWSFLLQIVGLYQGHPAEAKAMFPAARAAAARAGDPPEVLVHILDNESSVLVENGEYDAALAAIAEAHRVLEAAGARRPGSPLARHLAELAQSAGEVQRVKGQLDAAAASLREALTGWDGLYGPETVEAGAVQLDLAQLLRQRGELADAELAGRASVRIRARAGATPALAMAQSVLSIILADRGRAAEAVALGERAIELARATMPADDATLAELVRNLAEAYAAAGQLTRALALYDEVVATYARTNVTTSNSVAALHGRADLFRRLGRCGAAIPGYREAAARAVGLEGAASADAGRAVRGEGLCLAVLGRSREAIAALERGLAFPTPGTEVDAAQLARGALGRLLAVTGRDRARGKALVKAALARLHAIHATDPLVATLDAWLAAND